MNKLKQERARLGLTQEELAWRIGLSTRQLQRLEAGANVKKSIILAVERVGQCDM